MAELPDESLRSALEFAVAIAAVGVKLRPPMPIPSGFKPYLKFNKLPAPALATLRAAVEADHDFQRRLRKVATPELVDEVGMLWLTRPDGWEAKAATAARNGAEADTDITGELRREQKRRRAAEAVAARSRVESAALAESLELERTAKAAMAVDLRSLKAELAAARSQIKKLERVAEKKPIPPQVSTPARSKSHTTKAVSKKPSRKPIAVPGGRLGNSEAAGEHMLRYPGVTVLVDGYNVAKLGWRSLSLERQRAACIDAAENIARRWGTSLHVVFDGSSVVGAAAPNRRLIRVSYSPAGISADDVLRAEVAALDISKPVVVVTNDQAVVNDVRKAGANVVSSDTFLALARR